MHRNRDGRVVGWVRDVGGRGAERDFFFCKTFVGLRLSFSTEESSRCTATLNSMVDCVNIFASAHKISILWGHSCTSR